MIELEDLKEYLQIAEEVTDQDTFLQKCIDRATGYIYSYCNRKFVTDSYTETVKLHRDELWNKFFYVKNFPVAEVIEGEGEGEGEALPAIKIEYLNDDYTWTELTDISFGILPEEGKIFIDEDLSIYKSVRVTYTGGYALEDMPEDLRQACIMQSVSYYQESHQGEKRLGINARNWNSQVSEGATYKDIEEKVNKILDKYRLYNI